MFLIQGLTFAACKIIDSHQPKLKHIFNTNQQICYNGINIDTYFLQYLTRKFQESHKQPLFSFTALNLAHDPEGFRIQGLDDSLKEFFSEMTQMENTLTILFSDHGNTYTEFVYQELDGRYEQYHPSLFIIAPRGVKKYLGEHIMYKLKLNQKRLLNLIDIHHTVKHIVNKNHKEKGILDELPVNRTCGDLLMAMPNLCVCRGWDSPVKNTTELMIFVELAVGEINNLIGRASPSMKCKRLIPISFHNILQRKSNEEVRMTFDINTRSGIGSKNFVEKISVEVAFMKSDKSKHFNGRVVSFDRISQFGEYRKCSDADFTFRFCVCDHSNNKQIQETSSPFMDLLIQSRTSQNYHLFTSDTVKETIEEKIENKLALATRKIFVDEEVDNGVFKSFIVSITFEVINISPKDGYSVQIVFNKLYNLKPLTNNNCSGIVNPRKITFLCVLGRQYPMLMPEFDFTFKFSLV